MRRLALAPAGFGLLVAGLCWAQTPPSLSFAYKGASDPSTIAVGAGGALSFPNTLAGTSSVLQFFITNNGTAPVQITAGISGPAFSVSTAGGGITVQAAQTGQLTLTFAPTGNGAATGTLTVQTADSSVFKFTLTGTGVAPNLITSFQMNPGGNQIQVGDGGSIAFPTTQVSQTATATIAVTNRGTAPGTLSAATVSGSAFTISGLALLPAQIAAGSALQFTLVFAPAQAGGAQGSLQIALGGVTETISLSGQGSAASFLYQVIAGSSASNVAPNGTIQFPDTALNQTSSLTVEITNTGNVAGTVSAIAVTGTGFQIANLSPLPLTLTPGGSTVFTVNFTPAAPGSISAKLIVDSSAFTLTGSGVGPQLTLNFAVGSSSTAVANNGVASFPNTAVGSTTTAVLHIQNSGNAPGTINSIGVTSPSFGATVPALPVSIAAGSALDLPLVFSPNAVGSLTGTLTLDSIIVSLKGIGTAPANLPAYQFTGVGTDAPPMTQPGIGLTLASPYGADITGTLTLTFAPASFVDDPTIQFASGGRTVNFKIPANTTSAIFGSGANSVQFQTGTVAGTITITPSFSTATVSLTPATPPAHSINVASGAPAILNVQLGTVTANTFELVISGYSTARSVTQINLQFTAAATYSLQASSLNVNTDSAFSSWYQTAAAGAVGSQFSASITVGVSGNIAAVQSVAVSAVNANGSSNAMSVSLH